MFSFLIILLMIVFLNIPQSVQAVNIVYPKNQNVTINADKTFFIGNENPTMELKINNESVKIHSSGGFKHTVYLNYGQNKFVISNGKEEKNYNITRPLKKNVPLAEKKFIKYETPVVVRTTEESNPLRSTPVDSGLNRLQHLQNGIDMLAIGEYGDFYKILLDRDDVAWINKSNVTKIDSETINSASILNVDTKFTDDEEIFTFKLSEKVPYVLSENGLNGYTLTLYNMNQELYPFGRYEFPIAQDGKNFGYSSAYNENNELVIRINKYLHSLKGLKITIDPGHGGSELGAIGCLGDKEKDVNLQIALKLKSKLEKEGAVVFLTRENDSYLGLAERVDFTNKNDSQMFISIHNNALPDSLADKDASGTEVYYFYSQSRYLAKVISTELSSEIGFKNRGAKGGSLAVIRNTNCPAVLVEVGFMIDPEDNSLLIKSDFQDKIAGGILKGIKRYFDGIDMEIILNK